MSSPSRSNPRVMLFGGAELHVNGERVSGRSAHRHAIGLLAVLLASGRAVSRDKLIALLWPERDEDAARNLLKVNLHELRKTLGDGAILSTGDQLTIDAAHVSSDVADFLAALDRGDDAGAAELYRGPFLDGFHLRDSSEFAHWADSERAGFASRCAAALERAASAAARAGDAAAEIRARRKHAELDPYRTDVAQRLIEALAVDGDGAGAVHFAESFARRRREELDLDDEGLVTLARNLATSHKTSPVSFFRPAGPPAAAPAKALAGTRRWTFAIAACAAAVVVVVFLGLNRTPESATAAAASIASIRVEAFRVVGSDTSRANALAGLLSARLGAPAHAARKATHVLGGEVAGTRDSLTVRAHLRSVRGSDVVAHARLDVRTSVTLAAVADRIAIQLLGRAAGEPEDRIGKLEMRPFIAARAYLDAQRAYRTARYAEAEGLYARALNADSTFGEAGLGLAMANSWTVINEHYGEGRDAAMNYLNDMNERDRRFALAFFAPDPALGPEQPAPAYLVKWEDLVEKYPDWAEAWYQLGDRYYHYGGLSGLADADERARFAFRRALEQDPAYAAPLHHLVELYAARRERKELREAGERYFAAHPTVARDMSAIGWQMAVALGDSAWLRRIRTNFEQMPREELTRIAWVTDLNGWPQQDALRAAALLAGKAGTATEHEKAAITAFALATNAGDRTAARAAAARIGRQYPDRPIAALWDAFAAAFAFDDAALAADAARRMAAFVRSPISGDHVERDQHYLAICMNGYWHATQQRFDMARSLQHRVGEALAAESNSYVRRNASVCHAMLAAVIEAGQRTPRADPALADLDGMLLKERVPPHVILEGATLIAARLHLAAGDTAAALVALRRREHLTGDPLFVRARTQLERTLLGKKP